MVLKTNNPTSSLLKAEGVTGDGGTNDPSHPGTHLFLQTVVSKVIGVCCPRHLQCHPGLTVWMDPDAQDEIGGIEKKYI